MAIFTGTKADEKPFTKDDAVEQIDRHHVFIKGGYTRISDRALENNKKMIGITIADAIESIGHLAFSGCAELTSIEIPSSVNSIGDSAFFGCINLKSVHIPDSVNNIGDSAFFNCRNLRSVTIPEGMKSIGSNTFFGCSVLENITVPDGVASIGDNAFFDCRNLRSITIPESVESIGKRALVKNISARLSYFKHRGLTVFTSDKSYAYKYCKKNHIKVKIIDFKPEDLPIDNKIYISEKITDYINQLSALNEPVNDENILAIKETLVKIRELLKEEKYIKSRASQLEQFLNPYGSTIIKIIESYCQIENQDLDGGNTAEAKKIIYSAISGIRTAFEKLLNNMYQNKILDITTDIAALTSMLTQEGLLGSPEYIKN